MANRIPARLLVGDKHRGFRFNITGGLTHLIERARLLSSDHIPFLTFLRDELSTLATNFYSGDLHAVDKGLQSFCLDARRPEQPEGDHCEYCSGKGEIETDNNGPIAPCPVCQLAKALQSQAPDVGQITNTLMGAWKAAEPDHEITAHITSYVSTFADMARSVAPLLSNEPAAASAVAESAFERGRQAAYDQLQNLISQAADATIYCMKNSIGKIGDGSITALIEDHQRLRALAHPPVVIDCADLTPEQVDLLRKSLPKVTPISEAKKEGPRWPRLRQSVTSMIFHSGEADPLAIGNDDRRYMALPAEEEEAES